MNKVIVKGNLVADPEVREIGEKKTPLTKFRVAVNEFKKTVFVDIETWDKTAQNCGKYLQKGSPVLIDGRLALDEWQTQDGNKRSRLFVVGNSVEFLGKLTSDDDAGDKAADVTTDISEDDDVPF